MCQKFSGVIEFPTMAGRYLRTPAETKAPPCQAGLLSQSLRLMVLRLLLLNHVRNVSYGTPRAR